MDCSGLTYISFAKNKIEIPRNSQEQARYGRVIFNRDDLKKGDLVFFTKSYSTSDYITHVGIYLGKGKFIHASTSAGVIETPLNNPWWSQRFVFGTRVF
jgi:cell wall-associated NlpC family hydrolase